MAPPVVDPLALAAGLAGGLALFLYGLDRLTGGLKAVAGDELRRGLRTLTANRVLGVAVGAFVTAVVQSSSVTTVILVGFVGAGLMTLGQALGVIIGANIGTTLTAQIVAFDVAALALPLIAGGFAATAVGRRDAPRQWGKAVMGLGFVFLGMTLMSEAVAPLGAAPAFSDAMAGLEVPAVAVAVGAAVTAVLQSSSATTAIVITLASQGLIALDTGIALTLGANIGTCVTALLATLGRNRAALRTALAHVLFNLGGALVWLPLIGVLADAVVAVSPSHPDLAGPARLAAEVPRQLANAHTLFNLANAVLFVGLIGPLARGLDRLLPDLPTGAAIRPAYLQPPLVETPALGLEAARREVGVLGQDVRAMLVEALPAVIGGSRARLLDLAGRDTRVDARHQAIVEYLRRIGSRAITHAQAAEMLQLIRVANALESIGDLIETDLVKLGLDRLEEAVEVSRTTRDLLGRYHALVLEAFDLALAGALDDDAETAARARAMKPAVKALEQEIRSRGADRLLAQDPNRFHTYNREMESLDRLKRIFSLARLVAKTVTESGASGSERG
jgi:phosphate:Na+ symporter